MKKLIVKTVAITLGILIAVSVIFYLILANASPNVLADVYFQTQNAELSIKYSKKAYEKSKDLSDLLVVVERSILFDDDDTTLEYGVRFINDEAYPSIIETKGQDYHYYVVGNICQIQYEKGDKAVAIQTAINNTGEYLSYNPIHKLILLAAQGNDKAFLQDIKSHLESRQNKNQLVTQHISFIDQLIN